MENDVRYNMTDLEADLKIAQARIKELEAKVPKWISVEERLPKRSVHNFEEYLVCVVRSHWPTSSYDPVDSPYDEEYITAAMYDYDQKIWHLGRAEVAINALVTVEEAPLNGEHITHWMPLPEPPKEG